MGRTFGQRLFVMAWVIGLLATAVMTAIAVRSVQFIPARQFTSASSLDAGAVLLRRGIAEAYMEGRMSADDSRDFVRDLVAERIRLPAGSTVSLDSSVEGVTQAVTVVLTFATAVIVAISLLQFLFLGSALPSSLAPKPGAVTPEGQKR